VWDGTVVEDPPPGDPPPAEPQSWPQTAVPGGGA
jgi:hypothetical protein